MDENWLFKIIWRFNAVAIAIGVILVSVLALVAVADMAARNLWRETSDVASPATNAGDQVADVAKVSIGRFSWLQKGKVLWAPIHGTQTFSYRVSSKSATSTRNFVFHDVLTGESRQLLPENRTLVAKSDIIRVGSANSLTSPHAIAFALVSDDTNGDGRLSGNDEAVIALTDGAGQQLTKLPVRGRLLSAQSVDQRTGLLVIETPASDVEGLTVDLNSFKILRRARIWQAAR